MSMVKNGSKMVAITIRHDMILKDDIHEEFIINVFNKCKVWKHCFVVAEKEGIGRHFHAMVYCEKPVTLKDIKKKFTGEKGKNQNRKGLCDFSWWDEAAARKCVHCTYGFNDDFVNNYLKSNPEKIAKGEIGEIIIDRLPKDTAGYTPTSEEQAIYKAVKEAKDTGYEVLEIEFKASPFYHNEFTIKDVASFMFWAMFGRKDMEGGRTMRIINDNKLKRQKVQNLYNYMNQEEELSGFLSTIEFQKSKKKVLEILPEIEPTAELPVLPIQEKIIKYHDDDGGYCDWDI